MRFDLSKLEIAPLAEPDLASIMQMAELLEEAPHWPLDSYAELTAKNPSVPRITLVARDKQAGEAIGFVTARLVPPEAELESVGVRKDFQRCGVGRRLLAALSRELSRQGVETVYLEVRASNLAALGLYRTFGFAQTGSRPSYYTDPVEDAVLMSLQV